MDEWRNVGSMFYTFTIDNVDPAIILVEPANGSNMTTTGTGFVVNVTDDVSEVESLQYYTECNATVYTFTNGTTFYPFNHTGCTNTDDEYSLYVNVTDHSGNSNFSEFIFNVDDVAPTAALFTINLPVDGSDYSGNSTELNFSITDGFLGIHTVWYNLDGGRNITVGTNPNSNTSINFSGPGKHTLYVYANDTVNNVGTSSLVTFDTTGVQLNTTNITVTLANTLADVSAAKVELANTTQITENQYVNESLNLEMNVSNRNGNIVAEFRNFYGGYALMSNIMSDDVARMFNVSNGSTGLASDISTNITNFFGTSLTDIVVIESAENFLADTRYTGMVQLPYNCSQYTDIFYCEDEVVTASLCTVVSECSSGAFDGTTACYNQSTLNLACDVFVPHFSVVFGANDTAAPNMTIIQPLNNSVQNNSFFTLTGEVYEENLFMCNFTIWGPSNQQNDTTLTMTQSGSTPYYTFSHALSNFSDGDYNVTLNCSDTLNYSAEMLHNFSISDSTAPIITAVSTSGTSSSSSSGTVTVTATTDEAATCWYSTTNFTAGSRSSESAATKSNSNLTHTFTIDYESSTTLVARNFSCMDDKGNNMTGSNTTGSIDVTVTSAAAAAAATSGGLTPGVTYTISSSHMWNSVAPGTPATMTIDSDKIGVDTIAINVKESADTVTLKVEKLGSAPDVKETLSVNVYQYLQFTLTNLANEKIESVDLELKVEKSWLAEKGLSEDKVALYKYGDDTGSWDKLAIVKTRSDANFVYYKVSTSGFSYYAIGSTEGITAFDLIDIIREFYTGLSSYTPFDIIDLIRSFYGG